MRAGVACVVLVSLAAVAAPTGEWRRADPAYVWSFPDDHWMHPGYGSEWWYFTGQLRSVDDPDRRFGFQVTFFRVALRAGPDRDPDDDVDADLLLGHAALGDLGRREHRFSQVLHRAVPWLGGFNRVGVDAVAWCRGPAGTDAPWTLTWNGSAFDVTMRDTADRFALELSTRPAKALVLHGENGYTAKGNRPGSGASMYYSFPRLAVTGFVEWEEERLAVEGLAWMDREFGTTQLREDQRGWDWFSLQLADGRDVMLYLMRAADGGVDFAAGTIVSPGGRARPLSPDGFQVESTAAWRSPASGVTYPSGWRVRVPEEEIDLRIEPWFPDQENRSDIPYAPTYWEGAVRVLDAAGEPAGQGYVELTGYGEGNRPAL